ncbi:MAG: MBL fold metallo-hydrolase [Alphaproteobacteria bacterium]|nr:MBL fold metallo-hydrolase [Alphaproteobacteria bacterium]
MKITILGCGGAGGVPLIGNDWGDCDPKNPKNNRLRSSILVEHEDVKVLVDTSPDMRQQLLNVNLKTLDAIFYTHAHADHVHGIDNIRSLNWLIGKPVPLYADQETMDVLKQQFAYIFEDHEEGKRFYLPAVQAHVIDGSPLTLGSLTIQPFHQQHGDMRSMGYRFHDFAYSTDVNALDEDAFKILEGVKIWIVDAVRHKPHYSHAHIDRALEWIERIKPQKAYLTHMNQTLDYETLKANLPDHVEPAYDGLVIEV